MNTIRERFCTVVADQLGVPKANIADNDTIESLGADSLDKIDLIMDIEEEFNFEVSDAEVEGLNTVGDFLNYIECNAH